MILPPYGVSIIKSNAGLGFPIRLALPSLIGEVRFPNIIEIPDEAIYCIDDDGVPGMDYAGARGGDAS